MVETIPDFEQSGTSANITWYTAAGWHVEVLCHSFGLRDGKRVAVPPTYRFRVRRPDAAQDAEFSYKPGVADMPWALPAETVTSQVRLHFEAEAVYRKLSPTQRWVLHEATDGMVNSYAATTSTFYALARRGLMESQAAGTLNELGIAVAEIARRAGA